MELVSLERRGGREACELDVGGEGRRESKEADPFALCVNSVRHAAFRLIEAAYDGVFDATGATRLLVLGSKAGAALTREALLLPSFPSPYPRTEPALFLLAVAEKDVEAENILIKCASVSRSLHSW